MVGRRQWENFCLLHSMGHGAHGPTWLWKGHLSQKVSLSPHDAPFSGRYVVPREGEGRREAWREGRGGTLMRVSSLWPHGIKCAVREHREWIPPKIITLVVCRWICSLDLRTVLQQGTQGSTESGLRVSSQAVRVPHEVQVGTDVSRMLPRMDPLFLPEEPPVMCPPVICKGLSPGLCMQLRKT